MSNIQLDSQQKTDFLCDALDEEKAQDIVILNVQGLTLIADYFIICTGNSSTHLRAISEGVRQKIKDHVGLRTKPEGVGESLWVVLDCGDVVVHIFSQDRREFYDLERLWSDAGKTEWVPKAPSLAASDPA